MAGTFIMYGECSFTSNQRRNNAANNIRSQATSLGLVATAYDRFPAGVVNATVNGQAGITISYSAPSIQVAESLQKQADSLGSAQSYEGWLTYAEI